MCGIAGIVSSDRHDRIELRTIQQMCNAIVHRGPDDEGILVKDGRLGNAPA
jgi:asparagine synthetase B (glutamine-hydrolysing)